MCQCINEAIPSRKCSITTPAKCKTSVYVLTEICLQWSKRSCPRYVLGIFNSWKLNFFNTVLCSLFFISLCQELRVCQTKKSLQFFPVKLLKFMSIWRKQKCFFLFQRRQEELERRAQELERREAELRNAPTNGNHFSNYW